MGFNWVKVYFSVSLIQKRQTYYNYDIGLTSHIICLPTGPYPATINIRDSSSCEKNVHSIPLLAHKNYGFFVPTHKILSMLSEAIHCTRTVAIICILLSSIVSTHESISRETFNDIILHNHKCLFSELHSCLKQVLL